MSHQAVVRLTGAGHGMKAQASSQDRPSPYCRRPAAATTTWMARWASRRASASHEPSLAAGGVGGMHWTTRETEGGFMLLLCFPGFEPAWLLQKSGSFWIQAPRADYVPNWQKLITQFSGVETDSGSCLAFAPQVRPSNGPEHGELQLPHLDVPTETQAGNRDLSLPN